MYLWLLLRVNILTVNVHYFIMSQKLKYKIKETSNCLKIYAKIGKLIFFSPNNGCRFDSWQDGGVTDIMKGETY